MEGMWLRRGRRVKDLINLIRVLGLVHLTKVLPRHRGLLL